MKLKTFIFFVCLLMVKSLTAQQLITLEDIWKSGTFSAKGVSGIRSMKDGEHYTTLSRADGNHYIIKYAYKTGKPVDTLYNTIAIKQKLGTTLTIEGYEFSADESQMLLFAESESIYRHSFKADYYVYSIKNKAIQAVSKGGKQQIATFSPNGQLIAFVRNNNMYVTQIDSQSEMQITFDGEHNKIINGASDWVYEEEFGFDQAYQWSPDSKKIAYYQFDESDVKEFTMPIYGDLYPQNESFKYPKAGEKNSIVNIIVYNISDKKNTLIDVGKETDQYISRIKWTSDPNVLSFLRMNRLQNKLELILADAIKGASKVILTENSSTYIDVSDDLTFLKDGKGFIWSSELEGFNHLYHYDLNGKLIKKITNGNWDIIAFKGINENTQTLYFTAAKSNSINKDIISVKIDGSNLSTLSQKSGYHEPNFSATFAYYIETFSTANSPNEYALYDNKGKEIRVLESNEKLKNKLKDYKLSNKEFLSIKTSDGLELNTWMIKPPNFDATKKYPVFFVIYGGPGRNTVLNSWEGGNYIWHQMLAQKGYIVVSVDNRGTSYKGEKFKKATYGELGKFETSDQIEAARYFGTLPYVDKTRIGMQGWSFGGYLSSLCITKGNDVFKTAIAVAPVTNWRYYDSIYTERFLGLPKDNAKGYDNNSPINFVDELKGNYLLIHGTADDNVHFQNSVEMTTALQNAGKQFDFMMYPDKNHGIGGGQTRLHLFTMMTNFILEKL